MTLEAKHDAARLSTQLVKVKELMRDGNWRSLSEIASHVQGSEAGVSARLRDLRKEEFGGFEVERRRRGDPKAGIHEYRVVPPKASPQRSLFEEAQSYEEGR